MTRCDHVGTFLGITKARCTKVFLEAKDQQILDALDDLGNSVILSEDIVKNLTRFVISIYCSRRKNDQDRFFNVTYIETLRWEFFSKYQSELDQLPPTANALKHHFMRSNYVAHMYKESITNFMRAIPIIGQGEEHG